MNPNREELRFGLVLTKPAAERAAWLDRECGDAKALRARLDTLLAVYEQAEPLPATQANRRDELHESQTKGRALTELGPPMDEAVGQTLGRGIVFTHRFSSTPVCSSPKLQQK